MLTFRLNNGQDSIFRFAPNKPYVGIPLEYVFKEERDDSLTQSLCCLPLKGGLQYVCHD